MSKAISFKNSFSGTTALPFPQWLEDFEHIHYPNRYKKEGMSDLVIVPACPSVSKEKYKEAEYLLKELQKLSTILVRFEHLTELFKLVNMLVSNPLPQNIFVFKIQAIYTIFRLYPEIVFNENTCHKLATLSSFFPSAYEIKSVVEEEKRMLENKMQILKKITDIGCDNF